MAATIQDTRRIALALSGVLEGTCHGTLAFYLRGSMMVRLRDDLETPVVKVPVEERASLIEDDPDVFSVTEHYLKYNNVLVSLPNVSLKTLEAVTERAWMILASKRQIAAWNSRH